MTALEMSLQSYVNFIKPVTWLLICVLGGSHDTDHHSQLHACSKTLRDFAALLRCTYMHIRNDETVGLSVCDTTVELLYMHVAVHTWL